MLVIYFGVSKRDGYATRAPVATRSQIMCFISEVRAHRSCGVECVDCVTVDVCAVAQKFIGIQMELEQKTRGIRFTLVVRTWESQHHYIF